MGIVIVHTSHDVIKLFPTARSSQPKVEVLLSFVLSVACQRRERIRLLTFSSPDASMITSLGFGFVDRSPVKVTCALRRGLWGQLLLSKSWR